MDDLPPDARAFAQAYAEHVRQQPTAHVRQRPIKSVAHAVYTRDKSACRYCGTQLKSGQRTLDHVLPKSRGGLRQPSNLVTACRPCNNRKAERTPDEAGMVLRVLIR